MATATKKLIIILSENHNQHNHKGQMLRIIRELRVPNVIIRYIMMRYLDFETIAVLVLHVKEANVLNDYSKDILVKARKGFAWNCGNGHLNVAQWLLALGGSINIHADDEYAFHCSSGKVLEWLQQLKN